MSRVDRLTTTGGDKIRGRSDWLAQELLDAIGLVACHKVASIRAARGRG